MSSDDIESLREDDSLIAQEDKFEVETGNPSRFLFLKLNTIICFFFSLINGLPFEIRIILVYIPLAIEFWFNKNADGMELVGMRWSHEIENGNPKIFFYARPDPYVPEAKNTSAFYFGLFGATTFWGIVFIVSIFFASRIETFIMVLHILIVEGFNTFCFLKCHSVSAKQADDIARTVMLGDAFDGLEDDVVIQIDTDISDKMNKGANKNDLTSENTATVQPTQTDTNETNQNLNNNNETQETQGISSENKIDEANKSEDNEVYI